MKLMKTVTVFVQDLTQPSKRLLKSGGILALLLYSAAVFCFFAAGRGLEYYAAMRLSSELTSVIVPSLGVFLLGVILYESVTREMP